MTVGLARAADKIRARILELEGKTVGAVEPWATTGGVRQATLLHTEELEELRRQLAEAERTADAARLAAFAAPASIRREDRVCPGCDPPAQARATPPL